MLGLTDLLREYGEQDDHAGVDLTVEHSARSLQELGFDSLGVFNVAAQISGRYGVEIPYDDTVSARTVEDLLQVVNKALTTR